MAKDARTTQIRTKRKTYREQANSEPASKKKKREYLRDSGIMVPNEPTRSEASKLVEEQYLKNERA